MAQIKTDGNLKDWQHVVRVVLLVSGVLGTLALGVVLHVETAPGIQSAAQSSEPPPVLPDRASESLSQLDGLPAKPSPTPRKPSAVSPSVSASAAESASEPASDSVRPPSSGSSARALSMRVSESAHLVDHPSGWTLQFMLTCDDAKAQRVLRELGQDARLHLLPTIHDDRPCLRICWNRYSSRDEAVADRDLPAALLALTQKPMPRKLTDLAP